MADTDGKHTDKGAPTDAAHKEAGDGSTDGAVPAGLTVEELLKRAEAGDAEGGGTG